MHCVTIIQRHDFVFCVITAMHLLVAADIAIENDAMRRFIDVHAQSMKAIRVLDIVNNHLPSQIRHAPSHCGDASCATIGDAFWKLDCLLCAY